MTTPTEKEPTNKLTAEQLDLRYQIFQGCKDRMENMGLTGRKRDNAALDYLCGSTQLLKIMNHELYNNMMMVLVMVIATRGYSEMIRMMEQHDKEKAAEKEAA